MKDRFKLISFDFDGVMIEQVNSWGFLREYKKIPEGKIKEYKVKLNPKEFRDSEHELFKAAGLHYNDFVAAGKLLKLQPYVKEVVKKLHKSGMIIIINSAAPHIMIQQKVNEIGPEYIKGIYSMEPQFDEKGFFYDTILPFETEDFNVDKIAVIEHVRKEENIASDQVVHIGDGLTDIICFKKYYGISYNVHHEKVKLAAHKHIESLKELIDLLV
ncbi:MAG: HAD-IB family phosphatase [Candidatus Helarchaeota archaeon]